MSKITVGKGLARRMALGLPKFLFLHKNVLNISLSHYLLPEFQAVCYTASRLTVKTGL